MILAVVAGINTWFGLNVAQLECACVTWGACREFGAAGVGGRAAGNSCHKPDHPAAQHKRCACACAFLWTRIPFACALHSCSHACLGPQIAYLWILGPPYSPPLRRIACGFAQVLEAGRPLADHPLHRPPGARRELRCGPPFYNTVEGRGAGRFLLMSKGKQGVAGCT